MTVLQITWMLQFVLGGLLSTLGSNKLIKLSHSLYADETFSGFRPPRRILKRIREEHKGDKDTIKKLENALTLEIIGLLTYLVLLLTLFYGLQLNT